MSLDTAIIQQYYAGILRLQPSAATINAYAQLPSYEAAMDAMMNAAVASVNPITKLYQAAFDRVPDSAGLTNYTAAYGAGAGTMTLQQIANQWTGTIEFTTDYPASMPNADYVGLLYWNVLHRAADPVGAANFTTALNNGTMTRADVLLELSQSPEFAYRIDGHIRGFQEQCALNNPAAYTGTLWDKVPPGPGETFTLTTGIDVFTATTDNATFNAVADAGAANTMNSGDVLTGAGGVNTLNILGTGFSFGLVETHAIQNVSIRSAGDASGFSQLLMQGVELVSSDRSLFDTTVNGAQISTTYALNNTVAGQDADLTINYLTDAGTADVARLAVNNAGDRTGSTTTTQTITLLSDGLATDAVEAVALETAGTNYIVIAAGSGVEEYVVNGSGENTISFNNNTRGNALFDLSESTGSNTLSFAPGLVRSGATIVGGTGADTITVASSVNRNYATPTISGVETLSINQGAGTFSIGLGRTTGLTNINLVAAAGNDGAATTLSQMANGIDINMTALAANAAGANDFNAVTILGSFAGVADQQTINVDTTADLIDAAGLLTTTGLETLNYVVTGDADNFAATLGGVTSTSRLSALTVSTEGFTAATEVNVALGTVTATGATLDVVDFSGANTGVSVAFAAASLNDDAVVLGGSGNDTINAASVSLSANTASITVVGGLGADTMTAIGNTANDGSTVFAIAQGDSGITVATADSILGWDDTDNTGDYLALGVAGDDTAGTGNFVSADGALTFAQALAAANTALTTLAATTLSSQIYSLQVDTGADIGYLFTDYNLDGTADQVVLIQTIATAAGFSFDHIIA